MNAIVCGANGAMGQLLCAALGEHLAGKVSLDGANGVAKTFAELGKTEADTVIDFSHHSSIGQVLDYAIPRGLSVVIGTTGHTEEEKQRIVEAAKSIPVFFSGNMSLGIAVLCRLAAQAASAFPEADIEIVETHHNRKVDAPSGTALMLFRAIQGVRPQAVARCGRSGECKRTKEEIGVNSIRMGNVVGIHEIHICTPNQTLTLRHEAHNRAMFAEGAVKAAKFLVGKGPGLYDMEALLAEAEQ